MTRFMWWTLVWWSVSMCSHALAWHYSGGYQAYRALWTDETLGFSEATMIALYFGLWFGIVKQEPR